MTGQASILTATAPLPVAAPDLPAPGSSASRPVSGPLLFARYAFGPNRLGYCGPDDAAALFELAVDGRHDRDIRALAEKFEGAWPYLELIARANGRHDPLDRDVVEAYWLGNRLLDRVQPNALGPSLETRFRARLRSDSWRWLAGKPADGAKPVHAFHVLDVFPRVGLLRSDRVDDALAVMDSCRIRWGRVINVEGDWLIASVTPLRMVEGRLALGPSVIERVQAWRDGAGFVSRVERGDVVSIHWSWACDRLDARRLANLIGWTRREVALANQTI